MGLDIYLHHVSNKTNVDKREQEYERRADEAWAKVCGKDVPYAEVPPDKRQQAHDAMERIAKELRLNEHGSAPEAERKTVELDSKKYPEHYWKIGYFRSSYNESGINNVMRNLIGTDLYDIFQPPEDNYEFAPDWAGSKRRAQSVLKQFRAFTKKLGNYRVTTVRANPFIKDKAPSNEAEAVRVFMEVHGRYDFTRDDFGWFSNGNGEYFLKPPMQVVAAIPGTNKSWHSQENVTYLLYKPENNDEGYASYLQALEILIETCDWVLAQPNPEQYYLSWSG